MRDLDRAVDHGLLPRAQLANTSKTGIALQDWSTFEGRLFWAHYKSVSGFLVLEIMKPGDRSIYDPPLDAGVLTPQDLANLDVPDLTQTVAEEQNQQTLTLEAVSPETRSVNRVVLYPALGYRIRSIERRTPEGRLTSKTTMDDYRIIDGIPYPFVQRHEQWEKASGKMSRVRTVTIQSASFRPDLGENDYSIFIPAGTEVDLSGLNEQRNVLDLRTTRRDFHATITELIRLAAYTRARTKDFGSPLPEALEDLLAGPLLDRPVGTSIPAP